MGDSLTRPGSDQERDKREGKGKTRRVRDPVVRDPVGQPTPGPPDPGPPNQISFRTPALDSLVFLTSTSIAAIPMSGSTLAPSRMGANE